VLVICGQCLLERTRPAEPLKPRRDLGVIQVWMVAAAGADELEQAGVAAFEAAVHDADWLAPHHRRLAMAGLTGKRECHHAVGFDAQPRIAAIAWPGCGDGGRTDPRSGSRDDIGVARSAHSSHRQAVVVPALPGSGADGRYHPTIHSDAAQPRFSRVG
jgi:hypothetical protein